MLVKVIDDPGNQRRLGANHGQRTIMLGGKTGQTLDVHGIQRHVGQLGFKGCTGVTGRHKDLRNSLGLGELPGQCVLATATAHNQNIHTRTPCCDPSVVSV